MPTCLCNVTARGGGTAGLGLKCETGHSPVSRECAYPDLGLHTTKLMVCEPMAVRNQLDVSLQVRRHTCVRVGKRRHMHTHVWYLERRVVEKSVGPLGVR
jgi:hypothetical protein